MQNTVVLEPVALEPIAFSQNPDLTARRPVASWQRTLARKWDMIAVIVLMLASGTYGVYALLFLTGH